MIPGLEDTDAELFVNKNGELKGIHNGHCTGYEQLPKFVLQRFTDAMLADEVAMESLKNDLLIQDPIEQFEKYYKCNCPIIDETPDMTIDGLIQKEVWDCPTRSGCLANGKVCKLVSGPKGSLTPQETKIYFLTCSGLLDKEIADRTNCSINTVETHQKRIKSKLGLSNRVEYLNTGKYHL